MEILVRRIARRNLYTIGKLYIDGKYICDTIEDRDRGLSDAMPLSQIKKLKVQHKTAIPVGTYKVTMNVKSPRFSQKTYYKNYCDGYLPRLLNVKGFDGILMHRGTDQDSSSGCLILGYNTQVGKVTDSQKAFETVYAILKKANANKQSISITIK